MAQNNKSLPTGWSYALPTAMAGAATLFQYTPHISVAPMKPEVTSGVDASFASSSTTYVDERVMAAKLETIEARTETKFERLIGKIDALAVTLSGVSGDVASLSVKIGEVDAHARNAKSVIITTIIGAAIGIVGLAFAAVAIFQSAMGTTATAYQSGMAAAEVRKK